VFFSVIFDRKCTKKCAIIYWLKRETGEVRLAGGMEI